jgi:hypothetical protein
MDDDDDEEEDDDEENDDEEEANSSETGSAVSNKPFIKPAVIDFVPAAETIVIEALNVDPINDDDADDDNEGDDNSLEADPSIKSNAKLSSRMAIADNSCTISTTVEPKSPADASVIPAVSSVLKDDDDDDDDNDNDIKGADDLLDAESLVLDTSKENAHPVNFDTINGDNGSDQLNLATQALTTELPTNISSLDMLTESHLFATSAVLSSSIDTLTEPLLDTLSQNTTAAPSIPSITANTILPSTTLLSDDPFTTKTIVTESLLATRGIPAVTSVKNDDNDGDDIEGDDNSSETKSVILDILKENAHPVKSDTINGNEGIVQINLVQALITEVPTSTPSANISTNCQTELLVNNLCTDVLGAPSVPLVTANLMLLSTTNAAGNSCIISTTEAPEPLMLAANGVPVVLPVVKANDDNGDNIEVSSVPPVIANATLSSTMPIPDNSFTTSTTVASNPPVVSSIVEAVSSKVAFDNVPNLEVLKIRAEEITTAAPELNNSGDEGLIDRLGLIRWNHHKSCLKKRAFVIKLKIKVPHFKRSVIGRNASNRSLISILSPQLPMWSSLSSLRFLPKNLNQSTQNESPIKDKMPSSIDDTGYFNRPKLSFSRQASAVTDFYPPPWIPVSTKISPWKPKMIKIPIINFNVKNNETVVKKILSVLPPLHSIVSQYESSDIFLHRILKAYQMRCLAIDNDQRSQYPSKPKLNQDTLINEIDLPMNEKESMCSESVLDTGVTSEQGSVVHTPVRPSSLSPSSSTRSPKAILLSNFHESPPPVTAQNTPINSVVKSIVNNSTIKMTPRRLNYNRIDNIDKKSSKLFTPTKASTASKYQRQFFCADNRPSKGSPSPRFLTSKHISCQTENMSSAY